MIVRKLMPQRSWSQEQFAEFSVLSVRSVLFVFSSVGEKANREKTREKAVSSHHVV